MGDAGMNKTEFIESYINKLEDILQQYNNDKVDEDAVFDCVQEIRNVFIREIPEIEDAIWLRSGYAERDAKSVIGILKLKKINTGIDLENSNNEQANIQLKRLKLEYNGIKETIKEYTSESNIINYIEQLGEAIASSDIDSLNYCLSGISEWYNKNISNIHNNPFNTNSESHNENKLKIEKFKKFFEKCDSLPKQIHEPSKKGGEPLIFLSHKSSDKKYADALEEFITGLGVKNEQLIYTSHPLHKIPLDSNIYDYLRENIYSKVFVIILWSNSYLESPACLNEMGAAWVTQSDYTNIYVPSFSFGNPKYHECAVDTRKMGAVLNGDYNCKASMIEFKDKIEKLFNLKNDEKQVTYLLDKFIKKISEENINGKVENADS